VKYEQGFYIPEDGILHSHRRGNLKSYKAKSVSVMTGRSGNADVNTPHSYCIVDLLVPNPQILFLGVYTLPLPAVV
jgi:hypothetical protein